MNPYIRLFSHTVSDGNLSMTIEGASNFNNSDFPLYLMVGDTTWAMTLDDAIAIARAVKFIARRVLYAHKRGEPACVPALLDELQSAKGGDPRYDSFVAELEKDIADILRTESTARWFVERIALALSTSLLIRNALHEIADAFVASRLAAPWPSHGNATHCAIKTVL